MIFVQTYHLKDYLNILKENNLFVKTNISSLDEEVLNISYNSKEINSKTLFICKGIKYKEEYLEEAIEKGIICYVGEKDKIINEDFPYIEVKDIRKSLSLIAILYYNNPASKLKTIGITGTKGKSTTAYYIKSILDNYMESLNKPLTGITSSIDVYDGKDLEESLLTSPESLDLQRHFANAVNANIENFVMEVSSQALKYDRVYGINYDVGVFLNISPDHISDVEHPTFEDYFHSKLKLFKQVKNLCLNLDTEHLEEVMEYLKKEKDNINNIITFSTKNKGADIYAYKIKKIDHNTIKFKVRTKSFEDDIILTMPGLFNVENALAAISVAEILHIPYKNIYNGLKLAHASGRMEISVSKDEKIIAIVDYAHNKLSFEKLYKSVKEEYPNKKIITVFGCPGGKAFNRREDLGLLSGENSFKTYLTAEDPGVEDPYKICEEIAYYVKKNNGEYEIITDREEAIKKAILDNKESVILITGKGNETRQKYGNKYLPWKTDTLCVKEALNEYESSVISS